MDMSDTLTQVNLTLTHPFLDYCGGITITYGLCAVWKFNQLPSVILAEIAGGNTGKTIGLGVNFLI